MAEMVSNVQVTNRARLRSMTVPREHGAWGMLLVPLAIGGAVGLRSTENLAALLSLVVVAVTLLWLRTPVEALLGTTPIRVRTSEERRNVVVAIAGLGVVAAACLVTIFWNGRNLALLPIGFVAAAAFGLQAMVKRAGRKGRMPAQIIGAIGLTSTAAAAYCVANGGWAPIAFALWAINFMFAAGQVHYVQVRIHSSRATTRSELLSIGDFFLLGEALLCAVVAGAWYFGLVPGLAALAFAPLVIRGFLLFARRPGPLNVHRLGWTELTNAVLFGTLLCAAYWNH
jgi:YwiC-like protein